VSGLAQVELGGDAGLVLSADEPVGGLLRAKGVLREGEGVAVGGEVEVGGDDVGDEERLSAAAGLLGRLVFLPGLLVEAAHAAEEIDLPGEHAEACAVALGGAGSPGLGKFGGGALLAAAALHGDGGEE
jgi:hypothetical protein